MIARAKWIFWGLVLASVVIMAIPSVELLDTLRGYHRFLTGFSPGVLRPLSMSSLPDSPGDREAPSDDISLSFVEFVLSAPKAKEVRLAGDFTQWERGAVPMHPRPGGRWEVLIPLPPGMYHYRFMVDGKAVLDPKNPVIETTGLQQACVREVK
ncbi:MAG: glycogen-binding domain-containing protein [Elusimicrobia bacterium]|nr:glycogen-binding domain-containing protein [Elusimicrobiota bacterium]